MTTFKHKIVIVPSGAVSISAMTVIALTELSGAFNIGMSVVAIVPMVILSNYISP